MSKEPWQRTSNAVAALEERLAFYKQKEADALKVIGRKRTATLAHRDLAHARREIKSYEQAIEDASVLERATPKAPILAWKEFPSVCSGGKKSFFVADTPLGKRWVVWDRIEQKWIVEGEQTAPRGESPVYGRFDSSREAKQFVESSLESPFSSVAPPRVTYRVGSSSVAKGRKAQRTDERASSSLGTTQRVAP